MHAVSDLRPELIIQLLDVSKTSAILLIIRPCKYMYRVYDPVLMLQRQRRYRLLKFHDVSRMCDFGSALCPLAQKRQKRRGIMKLFANIKFEELLIYAAVCCASVCPEDHKKTAIAFIKVDMKTRFETLLASSNLHS